MPTDVLQQPASVSADSVPRAAERRRRGRIIALVLLAALAGVAAGIGVGAAPWSTNSTPAAVTTAAHTLFVLDASSAIATNRAPRTWTISLHNTDALWFQDRPGRRSGTLSVSQLVEEWPRLFKGSAPNGAVLAPDGPEGHHPTAVALTRPSYDASTRTATFTITLDQGQSPDRSAWLADLTQSTAAANGRVVVFVDAASGTLTSEPFAPPVPPSPPAVQIDAAYTAAEQSIDQLQAAAQTSGELSAQAEADLQELANKIAAG